MRCSNCGTEINENSGVCAVCGAAVQAPAPGGKEKTGMVFSRIAFICSIIALVAGVIVTILGFVFFSAPIMFVYYLFMLIGMGCISLFTIVMAIVGIILSPAGTKAKKRAVLALVFGIISILICLIPVAVMMIRGSMAG